MFLLQFDSKVLELRTCNCASYPVNWVDDDENDDNYGFNMKKEKEIKHFKKYQEKESVINSADFSFKNNFIVYGCIKGSIKVR